MTGLPSSSPRLASFPCMLLSGELECPHGRLHVVHRLPVSVLGALLYLLPFSIAILARTFIGPR